MVVVRPGTFRMGSSEGQGDERPVHDVRVGTFAIGRYEVKRDEYASFVTTTDRTSESRAASLTTRGENLRSGLEEHPGVIRVLRKRTGHPGRVCRVGGCAGLCQVVEHKNR